MTKYLTQYRNYLLECLRDDSCDLERLLEYHRQKVEHFQHERFIHLVVTFMVAMAMIMCFIAVAAWDCVVLIPLAVILLVLLAFYLKHYYFLENTVQLLYKDYDTIYERLYGLNQKSAPETKS